MAAFSGSPGSVVPSSMLVKPLAAGKARVKAARH
jgi:hypothetical protein